MTLIDCLEKLIDSVFRYIPRKKPAQTQLDGVCLIAHRGAFDHNILENTEEAFDRALALGCFGVELDIHETADKIWVVNHDPDLNRLWHKNAAINQLTFHELRALVPEVLSLEEVVAKYGQQLHLFIELKHAVKDEKALSQILSPLKPGKDYHLLALEEAIFLSLSAFPKNCLMLVPVHNNVAAFCQLSLSKNYGGVLAHYSLLGLSQKEALLKANQSVGVGFVNSRRSLYRELNRGYQWIFTNSADEVAKALKDLTKKD